MLSNALVTLGSLRLFVGFVAGTLFMLTAYRINDWHHNRRCDEQHLQHTRVSTSWVAGGLLVAFVTYSAASTYVSGERATTALARSEQTASEAQQLALDVADCQRQFNAALDARSRITRENDEESEAQREALAGWLRDRLSPPPGIRPLDPNDPVRIAWAETIERYYFGLIEASQRRQAELDRERLLHPYPEPTCGR